MHFATSMDLSEFLEDLKLEKNLKIFLGGSGACLWKSCQGSRKWPLKNPHLWKICWKFKWPYEYIFPSLWIDLSFGMNCVLSKCSVFTQEDFWRFKLLPPRSCQVLLELPEMLYFQRYQNLKRLWFLTFFKSSFIKAISNIRILKK